MDMGFHIDPESPRALKGYPNFTIPIATIFISRAVVKPFVHCRYNGLVVGYRHSLLNHVPLLPMDGDQQVGRRFFGRRIIEKMPCGEVNFQRTANIILLMRVVELVWLN
jgi:hypothetical protein